MPKAQSMSARVASFVEEKKTAAAEEPDLITKSGKHKKITLYMPLDLILALNRIRDKRLMEGVELGEVDKSKLVREAVQLLIEKEGV